jgi:hypothetical protein
MPTRQTASLITVAALASIGFAQDFTNSPIYKSAPGVIDEERKAALVKAAIDLPQPAEEPVAKLDANEFQMKQADYIGKVVELTFDQVLTLKQQGQSGYIATVTYKKQERSGSSSSFVEVVVPPEGLKMFNEVFEQEGTRKTTVMVQVIVGSKVRAIGERYRSDAPEGERYRW